MRREPSLSQKKRRRQKNFLPTFLLSLFFWGSWGWVVLKIPPEASLPLVTFCILLFLAAFLTSSLIFANSKLGLLIASFIVSVLLFRYFRIGNALNLALLSAFFFTLGLYYKN